MKFQSIIKVLGGLACALPTVYSKSQDYARHLELSLLFYEGVFKKLILNNIFIFINKNQIKKNEFKQLNIDFVKKNIFF